MSRRAAAGLFALTALLAILVRAIGWETVFPGDGTVIFALGDSFYHARRALIAFEQFPVILLWDPLLNHPNGAFVPWPPLYDLTLAGVARLFGDTQPVFERVAAWFPVALGAFTLWPVYVAGRVACSRAAGIGAAAIFAVLPATALYTNVGNADHHAAQALLGASMLALSLRAVSDREAGEGSVTRIFVALTFVRAALLLTWPGSLVYLVLAEGCLLLAGIVTGRRDLLVAEALSALATAALVWPVVQISGTPVGGPFSAIELSRLHVALLGSVALTALVVAGLESARPARSVSTRLVRAAVVGGAILLLLLASTGALRELALGLGYVAKTDAYEGQNLEQFPLFSFREGFSDDLGRSKLGFLAYLVPLAPIALLLRARSRDRRAPLLVLAAWSAALGALGLLQVRFSNDYAPAGSVAFAIAFGDLARRILPRASPRLQSAVATGLVLVCLVPVLEVDVRGVVTSARALFGEDASTDRALLSYEGTMVRFAELVREATPETPGFSDPTQLPAYGILAYPGIGHVLHYVAGRATPADNFGPYIGVENYESVSRFFQLRTEGAVLDEALRLGVRYVATTDYRGSVPFTLVNRLQRADGNSVGGAPPFVHFRLVTEGPAGGRPIGERFGGMERRPDEIPYKLFEIVPGALLEAQAPPGTPMRAEVTVKTPAGRSFDWKVDTAAGDDGWVRLRVPYATETDAPARPDGPYRVLLGDARLEVQVPEDAVRTGATVPVRRSVP